MCRGWHLYRVMRPFPLTIALACLIAAASLFGEVLQSAVNLEGKQIDPGRAASGKVVVLIFVRTDCPISNRYAPTIQRLSAKYSDTVAFWLVYPDKSESVPAIRKHLHDYGYNVAALRDPQHALVKRSHVQVTPEAAVFAADGRLSYHGRIDNWYQDFGRSRSAPTTHELDDAIQDILTGKPGPRSAIAVGCYISDLE